MRIIQSTVSSSDIDPEAEEKFVAAIEAALKRRDQVRETYGLDEIGQKIYLHALVPYTDPDGENRWAILDSGPQEVDWQDTDNVEEAIETYEHWVREATRCAMPTYDSKGNEEPVWDESDVSGVSAKETFDGDAHNERARRIAAEWSATP